MNNGMVQYSPGKHYNQRQDQYRITNNNSSNGSRSNSSSTSARERFTNNSTFIIASLCFTILILLIDSISYINIVPSSKRGRIAYGGSIKGTISNGLTNGRAASGSGGSQAMVLKHQLTKLQKPIIYRFDITARRDQSEIQRKVPAFWRTLWANAGWVPEGLNLSQHLDHHDFDDIRSKLDTQTGLTYPQKRYIWKYLAMAAMGGGWVAHSDTFPLHSFLGDGLNLPNNGLFTIYGDERNPCLMSASGDSWLQMAKLLVDHAESYNDPNNEPWTEERALQDIKSLNSYIFRNEVYRVADKQQEDGIVDGDQPITSIQVWHSDDCTKTFNKRAVHFSLDENPTMQENWKRNEDMVVKWLGMWLKTCEKSSYFEDPQLQQIEQLEQQQQQINNNNVQQQTNFMGNNRRRNNEESIISHHGSSSDNNNNNNEQYISI